MTRNIGGRTIEELEHNMSIDEFIEWKAWQEINPIGEERLEIALGKIGMVLAAANKFNLPKAFWMPFQEEQEDTTDKAAKIEGLKRAFRLPNYGRK